MGKQWEASGQLQFTNAGVPAIAATAEFFEGGTTTPLATYTDIDQGTAHPDPVVADGNGRWPLVIIPYVTSYDVKVSTSGGTEIFYFRELPNAEPYVASDVPADEGLSTGDFVFSPKSGTRTGFVRVNGRTIGSATSGATERANADTEALFLFNWTNFSNSILAVSGGRGATAAADWAANKTIALLDGRGATLRGLDDMGNSAASALTLATFTTGSAIIGGSIAGVNSHTLTEAQLASHTHTGTTATESQSHTHTGTTGTESDDHTHFVEGTTGGESATHTHTFTDNDVLSGGADLGGAGAFGPSTTSDTTAANGTDHTHDYSATTNGVSATHTHTVTTGTASQTHTHTITTAAAGSGTAHNNVSKSILGNILQKL